MFTRFALNRSTIYDAIASRGATGLNATYFIRDDTSLPLSKDPPQWIVESWQLFNTSLARAQYDALDIAFGTGSDNAMYVPAAPRWAQDRLCGIFTFQMPKDYDNIRIVYLVLIMLIPVMLCLAGEQTKAEMSEERKNSKCFEDNKLTGLEWLFWKVWSVLSRLKRDENQSVHPTQHGESLPTSDEQTPLNQQSAAGYGSGQPRTGSPTAGSPTTHTSAVVDSTSDLSMDIESRLPAVYQSSSSAAQHGSDESVDAQHSPSADPERPASPRPSEEVNNDDAEEHFVRGRTTAAEVV